MITKTLNGNMKGNIIIDNRIRIERIESMIELGMAEKIINRLFTTKDICLFDSLLKELLMQSFSITLSKRLYNIIHGGEVTPTDVLEELKESDDKQITSLIFMLQ